MSVADRVRDLVAPICTDLGLDLYDVEYGGGRVRVLVDRPDGVDLHLLAQATRLISRELDHRDPVPGRYQLEVSSPGLERPLRSPDHYRRAVGQTVAVRLQPGAEEPRRLGGVLVEADDEGVTVAVDEPEPHRRTVRYADIERARTTFSWGATKPAKGPHPSGPASAKRPARVPSEEQEATS
jgi:ribosome maturation factor RimP